jgi:UDP-N-acetylmuramyl pentapeptide phosphotransferase/UDP-N-acetylglucosamine-1-phosphate transferase
MATATERIDTEGDAETGEPEIEPSALDETTHAEALLLYRDAEDNIRFSKGLQWKTMGGTIALFALLVTACLATRPETMFVKICIVLSLIVSCGSIYSLSILQSWQNTERQKIEMVIKSFSSLFGRVYGLKSRIEANIHRYTLIAFMAITILIANYVAASLLMKLYR